MKFQTTKRIATSILIAAALPILVAAQDQTPTLQQTRYVVRALSTLGGSQGGANGINNKGWLSGWATFPGDQSEHGVLWHGDETIDLGTLGGPDSAVAFPVKDDRGVIVGNSGTSEVDPLNENFCGGTLDTIHICLGFRWQNGRITPLQPLGGNNSFATAANNRGQISGYAKTGTQDPNCLAPQVFDFEGVIWGPKGQIQGLAPYPGDAIAAAFDINDKGQVVGGSGVCGPFNPSSFTHAVLWQNGSVRNLGSLGGAMLNAALIINNRGEVVGASDLPGDSVFHAFLWTESIGMQDLGTLPGDSVSSAESINERSQAVGFSCDQNGSCRAALWQDGVATDLNSLVLPGTSLYLVNASDINNRGEIAGYAYDPNTGEAPGFLAIPCDAVHAEVEGCMGQADGTSAAIDQTGKRSKMTLPENVREQLQRRMRFSRP